MIFLNIYEAILMYVCFIRMPTSSEWHVHDFITDGHIMDFAIRFESVSYFTTLIKSYN